MARARSTFRLIRAEVVDATGCWVTPGFIDLHTHDDAELEDAVRKLTSDIAEFHRIDAGRLEAGARADVVVVDPEHLDDTVRAVLVNGTAPAATTAGSSPSAAGSPSRRSCRAGHGSGAGRSRRVPAQVSAR